MSAVKAVTLKDKDDNELYPVTSFDLVCGKSFFWKKCSQVTGINSSTAWQKTPISGWALTFTADVGAFYKVEIATSYLCWTENNVNIELDMNFNATGATILAPLYGTATGTGASGTAFPRNCGGIIQATATSVTITPCITAGRTGSYGRADDGYVFVMKVG